MNLHELFAVFGRSAMVTGGASGIGFAIADILSDQGANVTVIDRDQAKIDAALVRDFLALGLEESFTVEYKRNIDPRARGRRRDGELLRWRDPGRRGDRSTAAGQARRAARRRPRGRGKASQKDRDSPLRQPHVATTGPPFPSMLSSVRCAWIRSASDCMLRRVNISSALFRCATPFWMSLTSKRH